MVKVGIGGAGKTVAVVTTLQPKGSLAVTVTTETPEPGIWQLPTVVDELSESGDGDHVKDDGTEAEPDGVNDTTAMVPPHWA